MGSFDDVYFPTLRGQLFVIVNDLGLWRRSNSTTPVQATIDSGMVAELGDASPAPSSDQMPSPILRTGELSIEITPRQASYKPEEEPQVRVMLTTNEDEELEVTAEATIEVSPPSLATIEPSTNKLIFSGEGLVHVAACYGMVHFEGCKG